MGTSGFGQRFCAGRVLVNQCYQDQLTNRYDTGGSPPDHFIESAMADGQIVALSQRRSRSDEGYLEIAGDLCRIGNFCRIIEQRIGTISPLWLPLPHPAAIATRFRRLWNTAA
jgi:hypothetical protein